MANKRLREILTAFSAVGWSNLKDRKKTVGREKSSQAIARSF